MNRSPVAAVVRGWVGLYTQGLPTETRAARRDEIDDDLLCEHEEAAAAGRSARSLDADIALRLLFGMPSDISWRLASRAAPASPSLAGSSMNTRTLGVLAIVAGLSYGILFVLFIPFGEELWLGRYGVLGVSGTLVGVIAFAAAALGLAWRFQDLIGSIGAMGALLMTVGAVASMTGSGLFVLLPTGSAMLTWDLGRVGVLSRPTAIVHGATAIVAIVGIAVGLFDLDQAGGRAVSLALIAPYLVTWVAIGVSLFRGGPEGRATSV